MTVDQISSVTNTILNKHKIKVNTYNGVATRQSNDVLVTKPHSFAKHIPQMVRTCKNQ